VRRGIRAFALGVSALLAALGVVACSDDSSATEEPSDEHVLPAFDASNFSEPTAMTNAWYPLTPGSRWVYEGFALDEGESVHLKIEFTVTDLTKTIDGIDTVVAWVADYEDGDLVEGEAAFYAQDDSGTVWFFGEYPEEYEDGEIVAAPTWIAGLEDARPGVKMYLNPTLETPSYYQGWGPKVGWGDFAKVDAVGEETCVVAGCYENVIVIAESSAGEEGAAQLKYFAQGPGEVRVGWRGADESKEELILTEFTAQISDELMAEMRANIRALEDRAYIASEDVYGQTPRVVGPQ